MSHRFVAVLTVGLGLALGCGGGASSGSGSKQPEQKQQEAGGDEAAPAGEQEEAAGPSESKSAPAGNYPAQEAGRRTEEKRTAEANVGFVLNREDGMAAGMVDKSWSFTEGRRTSVEKVNKRGIITQFAVLYGKREGKGLENWTPLPTESKAYTMKSPGEGLEIVDQDNKKITPEERTVIAREYGWVGKPNPLLVLLARCKGGEPVNLDKDEITALVGFSPEMDLQSVRARPAGSQKDKKSGREVTKLDVDVEGVITSKDTKLAIKMSGPALVDDKTGYVVDLALAGGIDVSGKYVVKERRLNASGKGKIKLGRSTKIF
jgi:hypothetical protein